MSKLGKAAALFLAMTVAVCGCGSPPRTLPDGTEVFQSEQDSTGTVEGVFETAPDQTQMPYEPPRMEGEITVSCYYEAEFLSMAAKQFMKTYPDVKISINSYQGAGGEDDVENYLTYLNTKIMTGKAEDILFTSYLPVLKYSEMGVFEDLSPYVSSMPEFNEQNYFMNVLLSAREESGELYILPYMAMFETIGFSRTLLSGHADIENELSNEHSHRFSRAMDIAKRLVEGTDKPNAFPTHESEESFADFMIRDSLRKFVDVDRKEVNIDSPEYIGLLKSIKDMSEKGYFDSHLDFYNVEYYFGAIVDYNIQAAFYSLHEGSDEVYCMPIADSEGKVSTSANPCVALNSASHNKELAWEFIRYLLSEEVQCYASIPGAAVNRKGFEAAVERYYSFYSEGNKGTSVTKEAYRDVMETWMNQINDCDTLDPDILWMMEKENHKYFTDQQTVEDTVRNLQRQLEQYFNE